MCDLPPWFQKGRQDSTNCIFIKRRNHSAALLNGFQWWLWKNYVKKRSNFLDFVVCNKGENVLLCEWKGLCLAVWHVEFSCSKKYKKKSLILISSMTPSLVKCLIHRASLVCRLQKSLHLCCSPSIRLPAHVSLSEAAKSWMTDRQPRCVVEGGPANTDPCTAKAEVVHVSQSSAWPCGSSRCCAARTERSEWDPLNAVVSNSFQRWGGR